MTLLPPRPILDVPVRFADEQRLLALALTYPDVADVVLDAKILRPTDFYHDQHSRIFTAMKALKTTG